MHVNDMSERSQFVDSQQRTPAFDSGFDRYQEKHDGRKNYDIVHSCVQEIDEYDYIQSPRRQIQQAERAD